HALGFRRNSRRNHHLGFSGRIRQGPSYLHLLRLRLLLDLHGNRSAVHSHEVQMKNRLRILRAEHNWSQADLAERLEVSRQSVNAIETGKFDPSLPLAFKLARLFNQPIETIFTDEE